MSRENLTYLHSKIKGADQPTHPRSLISAFVVRPLESMQASWACVVTIHSVTDIQVLPVPIQPKPFRAPNVHSTLRSMIREGFSRRSSTVGPGFIKMKPKISRYAYRQESSSRKVVQQKSRGSLLHPYSNGCTN